MTVLDSLKPDKRRKLIVSVLVDLVILAVVFKQLPFIELVLGEKGWDSAHLFMINVLYGPMINVLKVVMFMLPGLAGSLPVAVIGWLVEYKYVTREHLTKLAPLKQKAS